GAGSHLCQATHRVAPTPRSPLQRQIASSVLRSKKCARSGVSARRVLSWTFTRLVGSTRATIVLFPTRRSSRISEPSGSTTSTTASKQYSLGSLPEAGCRSSGRTPIVTCCPLKGTRRLVWMGGTFTRIPWVSAQRAPLASTTFTSTKFIEGEPVKPATLLFGGLPASS